MDESPEPNAKEDPTTHLHYHCGGETFGPIPREHLARLWQTNSLPDDTVVFISATKTWQHAAGFFNNLKKSYSSVAASHDADHPKPKPSFEPAQIGAPDEEWIPAPPPLHPQIRRWQAAFATALLIAAAAIGAMYFWTASRATEASALESKNAELEKQLAARNAEIDRLRYSTRKKLEPGEIQGRFHISEPDGTKTAQAGAKVLLFRRADVEDFLNKTIAASDPAAGPTALANTIINTLPFPLSSTATDSDGFYRFELPGSGEFVLHTNVAIPGSEPVLWFLAFGTDDSNLVPIDFTETNSAVQLSPGFTISNAR